MSYLIKFMLVLGWGLLIVLMFTWLPELVANPAPPRLQPVRPILQIIARDPRVLALVDGNVDLMHLYLTGFTDGFAEGLNENLHR